jgi:hypothetical protein
VISIASIRARARFSSLSSAREFADAELLASALEYFAPGVMRRRSAYATILAHEPGHFICLHHLGLIAHARCEHAAAARLIEQAISISPIKSQPSPISPRFIVRSADT